MSSYLLAKGTDGKSVLGARISNVEKTTALVSPVVDVVLAPVVTTTATPTPAPTAIPTSIPVRRKIVATPEPVEDKILQGTNTSQYTAQKINDVTWRVSDVENDDRMASPTEIVNALNSYRGSHGLSNLSWDQKLGDYAAGRAALFDKNGELDSHTGFQSYMKNNGFTISGFNSLGENSAYLAGPMNADHIVHNIFGADSSHDGNQLDSWTNIGVGVSGRAVNINFGKNHK